MKIEKLIVSQMQTNCYLVYDEKCQDCLIIDPGDDSQFIINKIKDLGLEPKAIIFTHGHFDHTLAALELKLIFKIPCYLEQKDLPILKRQVKTALFFLKQKVVPPVAVNQFLKQGMVIKFGNSSLKVIETPGHTQGSVTFLGDNHPYGLLAFVGDLMFQNGGVGRTDLKGGNEIKLNQSIKKILSLPKNTLIYPGHGEETTVDTEQRVRE